MEILGNILDNASKDSRQQVYVTIGQNPFSLCVEDDGPGVPVAKRKQLFERGTRLDTYREGHGVGLAIVAELVESYSGELVLDDSPLGGARFSVKFN